MSERSTKRSPRDALQRHAAEFGRVRKQLAHERVAAAAIVESIRHRPHTYRDRIPHEWITVGFVDVLASAAHDVLAGSPAQAAELATLATRVAALLDARWPRILRAQCMKEAWLELAEAHRCQGDHDEALRALDRAEEAIRGEIALAHDHATVDLARARVFCELGRGSEALALVVEATKIFREHDDRVRAAQCDGLIARIERSE